MTRSVPNLRNSYGRRYKVERDPAATDWADPWMHTIPTRTGTVYVHSATHAGVEIRSRLWGPIHRLTEAGYPVHIKGKDDVTTLLVPWPALPAVLPILRPFWRRKISPEVRRRLAEYGRQANHIRAQKAGKRRESDQRPA
jgi:hypothetical protein